MSASTDSSWRYISVKWWPHERDPAATDIVLAPVAERVVEGYPLAIAAMTTDGLALLRDESIRRPAWLVDWLGGHAPSPVLLVGVRYDVEVDTPISVPAECFEWIKATVDGPTPSASAQLQRTRDRHRG